MIPRCRLCFLRVPIGLRTLRAFCCALFSLGTNRCAFAASAQRWQRRRMGWRPAVEHELPSLGFGGPLLCTRVLVSSTRQRKAEVQGCQERQQWTQVRLQVFGNGTGKNPKPLQVRVQFEPPAARPRTQGAATEEDPKRQPRLLCRLRPSHGVCVNGVQRYPQNLDDLPAPVHTSPRKTTVSRRDTGTAWALPHGVSMCTLNACTRPRTNERVKRKLRGDGCSQSNLIWKLCWQEPRPIRNWQAWRVGCRSWRTRMPWTHSLFWTRTRAELPIFAGA